MILKIAPHARIIDITHEVRPQSILEGAILLERAVPYLPDAVHLAVVDPGVGASRRPVIVSTNEGVLFAGPDNGLLQLAVARLGGPGRCWVIENPALRLPSPSQTFHGRDIFSPAAAHLAAGVAPEAFGREVDTGSLVELHVPKAERDGKVFRAEVIYVDRFGNLQLNLEAGRLKELGVAMGAMLEVGIGERRCSVAFQPTFGSVAPGELVLTEDSAGYLSLSVNSGSAAELLLPAPRPGAKITLRLPDVKAEKV